MVNDYAEITIDKEPYELNCHGENTRKALSSNKNNDLELPTTTTISTIALQSGNTRLVIALLQSGAHLRLKVLELYPELSKLGSTVESATNFATSHDEVLIHLKNKQSPVEELLRQADHLISTQKPRAEVYAAMADTLGQAWKEVNSFLELRKQILDHNVSFQCRVEEFKISSTALEIICTDEQLPIEIESVRKMINKIYDLRREMLSAMLNILQEGKSLIEKLREAVKARSMDSLPDCMKVDIENAIVHIEKYLEQIHEQRKQTEIYFNTRKIQLEQCLALALLAIDLRNFEMALNDKITVFNGNSNQLGDSSTSTQVLLLKLKEFQHEAKVFQDRLLKITKSTEKLVLDGHFASEQAIEKAYTILEKAAEYINHLDQHESLLNRVMNFFHSVQRAFEELNYLEIQLSSNTYSTFSSEYINFYTQAMVSLSQVTLDPINEGYAILDSVGREMSGAEGVKEAIEELKNRKIQLHERYTLCIEENFITCHELTLFFEKYEALKTWFEFTVEAFIRDNADMGKDISMAQTFHKEHNKLLEELKNRENEFHQQSCKLNIINVAMNDDKGKICPKEEMKKYIYVLTDTWLKFNSIIDSRIHLSSSYIAIHKMAAILHSVLDVINNQITGNWRDLEEHKMLKNFEETLNEFQTLYLQLKNEGENFITEMQKNTDSYLNKSQPCHIVNVILENFTTESLRITELRENWKMSITMMKKLKIEHLAIINETVKIIELVSNMKNHLFSILNSDDSTPSIMVEHLEIMQMEFLPKLDIALSYLHSRTDNCNRYENLHIIMKQNGKQLHELYNDLGTIAVKYEGLLQVFMEMVEYIIKLENKSEKLLQAHHTDLPILNSSPPTSLSELKTNVQEKLHKINEIIILIDRIHRENFMEIEIGDKTSQEIVKIDMQQLKKIDHGTIESSMKICSEVRRQIQKCLLYYHFVKDLNSVDEEICLLSIQLQQVRESNQYCDGDDISLVESTADAFKKIDEIIYNVEAKVNKLISTTVKNLESICDVHSALKINSELSSLKKKWKQLEGSAKEIQKQIDVTIVYFKLIQKVENWYIELKKLLMHARKESAVGEIPQQPENILNAIEQYLKNGESEQEKRIEQIRKLSIQIFGTQRLSQFNKVIMANQEILDLCAETISELRKLAQNVQKTNEFSQRELEEDVDETGSDVISARFIDQQNDINKVEEITTTVTETTINHILKKAKFNDNTSTDIDTLIVKKNETIDERDSINVQVSGSPIFIEELQSIFVKAGSSPTIKCTVGGNPLPIVQWFRDETNVDDSPDYVITYNNGQARLQFLEITADDQGIYICKARNKHGEASTSAKVELEDNNRTGGRGIDQIDEISTDISNIIRNDDRTPQFHITSQKDLLNVEYTNDTEIKAVKMDQTVGLDSEQMTVIVGQQTELSKLIPPSVKSNLQDLRVCEGQSVTLDCIIIGQPEPEVIWYHDNQLVKESSDFQLLFQGDKCSLIIHEVVMNDAGRYKVVAVNSEGKTSSQCILSVVPTIHEEDGCNMSSTAPQFLKCTPNIYVHEGESALLECQISSKPAPFLNWSFNNEDIVPTGNRTEIQWLLNDKPIGGDDKNCSILAEGDRYILKIPEITEKQEGSVCCIAENTTGKATCTTQLQIHEGIEETDVIATDDRIDMQPLSSCERYLQAETDSAGSHKIDQGETTKMSSSISQSSMSKSCCTKEYKLSTKSSTLELCPSNLKNGITKSHIEGQKCSNESNGGPPTIQTHKIEEFQRIVRDTPDKIQQEKIKIMSEITPKIQKQIRKSISPRFISPITGMIVDQGSNVILEGVIDGFPQPKITWSKNGQDVEDNVKTTFQHNHVRLELRNVNVKDAGRYTCTAVNEVGNASSTADLVVKKTIFPPVFGKRLQAQIAKTGERVIMEVEITGTPEPNVTWYKDDEPLMDTDGELRQLGNCYLLIIDNAEKRHAGKYMVNAANPGGEAQSIADFAVFEPTPDTMVEFHKTIVYENMADKDLKLDEKKNQLPSAALTAEHIATTMIQPSPILKTLLPSSSSSSTSTSMTPSLRKIELITPTTSGVTKKTEEIVEKATRSEMISSTIESHQSETKSEQTFHMKLQHEAPELILNNINESPSTQLGENIMKKNTDSSQENENVETSVIAKKDALNFFESIAKEGETIPKINKAIIDLNEEAKDGNYDVKVDKLTKNYERSTKFEEVRGNNESDVQSKKLVQNMSNKLQSSVIKDKGIENIMIDFPYDNYKLPLLNTQRTIFEDTTASGSPIHGTLTISKLAAQSESAEQMLSGFRLMPGPTPEIDYMPKRRIEDNIEKSTDVLSKTKQLEQFQTTTSSPPVGGVKIFPTGTGTGTGTHQLKKVQTGEQTKILKNQLVSFNDSTIDAPLTSAAKDIQRKHEEIENIGEKWWSSTSDLETRSHISTDLSDYRCQSAASFNQLERSVSPKPSVDGLAMEKVWTKKPDFSRKSWPPSNSYPNTSSFNERTESNEPVTSKVTSHEKREEISEIPGCGITKTKIESSSSLETRSWNSKENRIEETIVEKPTVIPHVSANNPLSTFQMPLKMYKAETVKVDHHTLNTNEEQSITKKYSSQSQVEKNYQKTHKTLSTLEKLEAPNLVKAATVSPKLTPIQLYHCPSMNSNVGNEKIKDFQTSSSIFRGTLATAPKHNSSIPLYKTNNSVVSNDGEIILEPGTPPEIGYIPLSSFHETKNVTTEKKIARNSVEIPSQFQWINYSAESDYESDFGSYKSKCRSCASDNEEPKYRRVKAPIPKQPRQKSTEPEPPPPSSFEIPPPELTGPPRPMSMAMLVPIEKTSISSQQKSGDIDILTPGSPPIYVHSNIKPDDLSKLKTRVYQKVSGYTADTDEPINNSTKSSSISKNYEKCESVSMASSTFDSKMNLDNSSYKSSSAQAYDECVAPNKQQKGLFKFAGSESWRNDSGNDYVNRVSSVEESRNETRTNYSAKYSKPLVSGTEESITESIFSSSVSEIMEKQTYEKLEKAFPSSENAIVHQPIVARKSVLLPGSPPEIAYAPQRQVSLEKFDQVLHSNTVKKQVKQMTQVQDHSQSSEKTVDVEQTNHVMEFEKNPMFTNISTPSPFLWGQFKESDYASLNDSVRIRPRWTPRGSNTEDPRYKRVDFFSNKEFDKRVVTKFNEQVTSKNPIINFDNSLGSLGAMKKQMYQTNRQICDPLSLPVMKTFTANQDEKSLSKHLFEYNIGETANNLPRSGNSTFSKEKDIVQPYLDILPKKAPFFTTPIKDIAVVAGQTARFECIIEAEPQPEVFWSKNGEVIQNLCNFEVYYRNGVCRLVLPVAYPDDTGTYICTAVNNLGSNTTSATLHVKGNRKSIRAFN
ncbi:muscle M-line assembly protein unc-89 isoform X2 [Diachasma alloeum]|uniref:muscle M-line assembly protein unc-89 isoform X2 n=1 Tax=Diachasma alloeum TaxID=454923 RepID=UPI0007382C23|nr:muscle M-line assembly protein unc-89 isoform X2 [Diachasma alloeum]